jgi:hypothetical protein
MNRNPQILTQKETAVASRQTGGNRRLLWNMAPAVSAALRHLLEFWGGCRFQHPEGGF